MNIPALTGDRCRDLGSAGRAPGEWAFCAGVKSLSSLVLRLPGEGIPGM